MYRALSASVALGFLLATPAFADIRGAQCTTSDPYLPGGTATMRWTCTNGSPAAPDPEALDQIALGFPDGWTVACGSRDATDSGGSPVAFSCTASGQTVTYADTDGGAGEILPGRSWSFTVGVTAPATSTAPVCAFYTLSGDGSGGEPHEVIDCGTCLPAKGSVTIVKQTAPQDAGGQMFAFAGSLGAFSLTGGQSRTISSLVPGTYDVTETLPSGWKLTQITCIDPDGGSTFNLATSSARIDVDAGEHVTCTFLNTAQGSVTIVKQTAPQDTGGQMFAFAGGLGAFSLTGGQSRTTSNLGPGTYDVTENLPAGWKLSQITCVDPDGGSTFNLATSTASIDVDAGEHVTCTFLNTAQGSVTIVKQTVPQDTGGQTFAFAGGLGAFSLTGGRSRTTSNLGPGTYDVTENLPAGWKLSQITCVDPDGGSTFNLATSTASIDLDAGEHVTCTFLNTAQGSVTIVKQTVPQDARGQTFAFAGGLGAFSLTGGQSSTIPNLGPGTYAVTEVLPPGWELTQITCVDPDGGSTFNLATSSASIDLDAGEHVTCTFLNTAQGSVTIVKQTIPQDAGGQTFAFAGGLGAFSLTGGQSRTIPNLGPGTYAVTEGALPPGWHLTAITCVDPDGGSTFNLPTSTASIEVDAGERVTCTFLNTLDTVQSSVTIVKQTLPPDAGGQMFAFAGGLGAFALTGGQSNTISNAGPGTYAITEGALPPGWHLTDITCVDPDGGSTFNLATSTASIDLDAGEHVTCTFLNRSDDYVPPTPPPSDIPTLSTWMLMLLAGLLSVTGFLAIRSRMAG
ncbi:MAG: IPTL-CTERM sorting domain-containing protein [Holophagales bacterium]|nr:IPTL-CTERM sorting domain-containing protein [Holophagales bacterium]